MTACRNVRIKQGKIVRDNLGWEPFHDVNLDGKPVTLITAFPRRDGVVKTIFGNTTDLFEYDEDTHLVSYLTPRYETGTVTLVDTDDDIVGSGTLWAANAKAGDFISFGATGEDDPAATWYEVETVGSDTAITLTTPYSGAGGSGIAYTLRSTFTGDIQTPFFTEEFYGGVDYTVGTDGDRWYATNGRDPVVAWDGSATQVYRPDLGDVETCAYLRRNKNTMTYVAPKTSGALKLFSIRVSNPGEPENTVSGEAAELVAHGGEDGLIAAVLIGDLMALYGTRSITLAEYVGGELIYVFRTVVDSYGPVSPRGIHAFPDYHTFIGHDGQYAFDGSRAVPVNTHVWRDVVRRTSPARYPLLHSYKYEAQGEVLWVCPLTSDADPAEGTPETAYVEHYQEDVGEQAPTPHTYRDLPALAIGPFVRTNALTWDEISEPWSTVNLRWNDKFFFAQYPATLFGDVAGNIFSLDAVSEQNGVDPLAYARMSRVPIGTIRSKAALLRVYPFTEQLVDSENNMIVAIYASDTIDGAGVLVAELPYALAVSDEYQFVSPRISARYVDIQFGTAEGAFYWAFIGYGLDVSMGGGR